MIFWFFYWNRCKVNEKPVKLEKESTLEILMFLKNLHLNFSNLQKKTLKTSAQNFLTSSILKLNYYFIKILSHTMQKLSEKII